MFEVIFYKAKNEKSKIEEYLDDLAVKAVTSKNDRINRTKILSYICTAASFYKKI